MIAITNDKPHTHTHTHTHTHKQQSTSKQAQVRDHNCRIAVVELANSNLKISDKISEKNSEHFLS